MCNEKYNGIVEGTCQEEGDHKLHRFSWEEVIEEGERKGQIRKYETWWIK